MITAYAILGLLSLGMGIATVVFFITGGPWLAFGGGFIAAIIGSAIVLIGNARKLRCDQKRDEGDV